MKHLNNFITEKLKINKDTENNKYHYHPKTRNELKELVDKLIEERGNDADLNDIDTSEIEDMSELFYNSEFNGDISEWNVSNVKNMSKLFCFSNFDGNISNWDVSNVKKNFAMFRFSPMDKNRPKWYKE